MTNLGLESSHKSFTAKFRSLEAWRKNQIAVTVSGAFMFFGFTLVMPFLPIYIRELGIQDTGRIALWTGLILSVSPAIAALTAPLWGHIGDRIGLRPMAIRATGVNCLCWFLMAFASNVWQLFLLRAILGLFGGFNGVSVAAITQLSPSEKVSNVIGKLQSTQIAAAAIGPFVGGILAQSIGVTNTFFATASLMFVSFLSIILLYADAPPSPKSGAKESLPIDRSFLKKPEYLLPILLLFFIHMVDRSFAPIVPLFLEQLGTVPAQLAAVSGALISLAAFAEAFSAWLSGRLVERVDEHRLILLRLGMGLLIIIPMLMVTTPTGFFVLRVALGLLAGGVLTLAFTSASRVIPGNHRGTGFSILSSISMLGGSAGPIIAGFLAGISIRTVFLFNILVYAGLMISVIRLSRPSRSA